MTDQHPITPPPELVEEWRTDYMGRGHAFIDVAKEIARWGADMELEACCQSVKSVPSPLGVPFGVMASNALRAARRPKPPSLKEQALKALDNISIASFEQDAANTIRKALEQLND